MGGAVCGGPGGRQEFAEFARTGHRQALDEILQIGLRIDAMIPGADEQGIHHGGTLASFGAADEQPVRFSNGTGPNVVLGVVVVDLDPTVLEEGLHGRPLAKGVMERLAQSALGPEPGVDQTFECLF